MTSVRAIRTGSWLGPEADSKAGRAGLRRSALWFAVAASALLASPAAARQVRPVGPDASWPLIIPGGQYEPTSWDALEGWRDDDLLAAFRTFRKSCARILAAPPSAAPVKPLGETLREPCRSARVAAIATDRAARDFFERHFRPLRIARLGETAGFVTGYYEPVIDGSRTRTDIYTVPVYRRPSNLFVKGYSQDSAELPNSGNVFRKIGRRKLVPYYDRAQIEDGIIAGRGLEICWLKNDTDLLFTQIQGSARVRLEDGSTIRINYAAHNGYRYTPVGRVLIDRNIIPREEMSMQRIRKWMEANPEGAKDVRRQNKSYVFFREVQLADTDEAVGAQGVPLTPWRSIAVDKALHVYGTPFFIAGALPIAGATAQTPFHRLMIAQDTGSAIVGPARADLYFGTGAEAAQIAGRIRHDAQFAILVPRNLDPVAAARRVPLPKARPAAKADAPPRARPHQRRPYHRPSGQPGRRGAP